MSKPTQMGDLFAPGDASGRHGEVSVSERKLIPHKAQLGQFMTPPVIAQFMAGLFTQPFPDQRRLLDAGAGQGSLTGAFLEAWRRKGGHGRLVAEAYETEDNAL